MFLELGFFGSLDNGLNGPGLLLLGLLASTVIDCCIELY